MLERRVVTMSKQRCYNVQSRLSITQWAKSPKKVYFWHGTVFWVSN